MDLDLSERHTSTQHLMRTLEPNKNLPAHMRGISEEIWILARRLVAELGDGPELTTGLRKLREAKDCFVIQCMVDNR